MIEIAGLKVETSYREFGVILPEDMGATMVECDDISEAEDMITLTGGDLAMRHVYVTEWAALT